MDLVLGRFADSEIASLGNSELDDYELLLEAQDRDVFSWVNGEAETPSLYDTPVLRKIRAFHSHAGPIHIKSLLTPPLTPPHEREGKSPSPGGGSGS